MARIDNLIGGKQTATTSGRFAPVFNPATGEQSGELGLSSTADVDAAVQAAKKAFPTWSTTAPLKRARYMFKFKELLEANADRIAQAISAENGFVITNPKAEPLVPKKYKETSNPESIKGSLPLTEPDDIEAYTRAWQEVRTG